MAIYPQRATLWQDEALVTVGAALTNAHDSAQDHAKYVRQSTAANGDAFTQSLLLEAGVYTFTTIGYTDNNRGKLDWYLDGVLIVSAEDWYSASGTHNVIKTHTSITVTGDGRHVLQGVINGKNGSSSSYFYSLTKYWFTPSSDTTSV